MACFAHGALSLTLVLLLALFGPDLAFSQVPEGWLAASHFRFCAWSGPGGMIVVDPETGITETVLGLPDEIVSVPCNGSLQGASSVLVRVDDGAIIAGEGSSGSGTLELFILELDGFTVDSVERIPVGAHSGTAEISQIQYLDADHAVFSVHGLSSGEDIGILALDGSEPELRLLEVASGFRGWALAVDRDAGSVFIADLLSSEAASIFAIDVFELVEADSSVPARELVRLPIGVNALGVIDGGRIIVTGFGAEAALYSVDPGTGDVETLEVRNEHGRKTVSCGTKQVACEQSGPWISDAVGELAFHGSAATGDESRLELCAGGRAFSNSGDELFFAYREVEGDFTMSAHFGEIANAVSTSEIGLMVRAGLEPKSAVVALALVYSDSPIAGEELRLASRERQAAGARLRSGTGDRVQATETLGATLRHERRGSEIVLEIAVEEEWQEFARVEIELPPSALVGFYVAARDEGGDCSAFTPLRASVEDIELRVGPPIEPGPEFLRGDCGNDAVVDLSDAIFLLDSLFDGGSAPTCRAACDIDAGAVLELSDAIALLGHLFLGAPPPMAPNPACGVSTLEEELECASSSCE